MLCFTQLTWLFTALSFFLSFFFSTGDRGDNVAEDLAAADFKVKRNERTREAEDGNDFII